MYRRANSNSERPKGVKKHPRFKDLGDLLHIASALPSLLELDPSEGPDPERVAIHKADIMARYDALFPQGTSQEPSH